ncbi:MAG TPA: bifunctional DNA-formamidopyrimidine glycosylase/DNA-(apurinic or apyrimidinic site) lyase [Terracidiphilus sp.]|nr:bifunctional DNA-formamidopyrimidine glycosylase/DNA-(apurinic or apyrimidinic site) lyase [Terracidiphilus sp.]
MPELPEVETIARGVNARVRGDQIVEAWFGSHREPFKNSPARQAKGLEGRTILEVHRAGKHIVCELGSVVSGSQAARGRDGQVEAEWIVHLGMTGRLLVTTPSNPVEVHTHARLTMASGREVRFVDPRRFGRLEFRDLKKGRRFHAPGAEPLAIAAAEFAVLFRGRKLAIKAALLNQTLLAGVGNIYADESLFRAGIRPRRAAGKLTRPELERLRLALVEVLQRAIRRGGSSVSDYVDADGVRGFFQLEHRVYQRTGEPCLVCRTPIRRLVVAGRSTHYCPKCQR